LMAANRDRAPPDASPRRMPTTTATIAGIN
jgi:hypothetical protein